MEAGAGSWQLSSPGKDKTHNIRSRLPASSQKGAQTHTPGRSEEGRGKTRHSWRCHFNKRLRTAEDTCPCVCDECPLPIGKKGSHLKTTRVCSQGHMDAGTWAASAPPSAPFPGTMGDRRGGLRRPLLLCHLCILRFRIMTWNLGQTHFSVEAGEFPTTDETPDTLSGSRSQLSPGLIPSGSYRTPEADAWGWGSSRVLSRQAPPVKSPHAAFALRLTMTVGTSSRICSIQQANAEMDVT